MTLLDRFLAGLAADRELGPEIAYRRDMTPRPPQYGDFPAGLRPGIVAGLEKIGISRLFAHQSEAVAKALGGEDIVVVTPTASGKTLCYNIPVLERCGGKKNARALYIFPMKALEQDQLGTFRELAASCGCDDEVAAEIYDGDTTSHRRAKIRKNPPAVVITNPDMLHAGILAYHEKWERFFEGLDFVVLDEVHLYRGVFGSHMAGLLRRLFRVAARYGSRPQVVACSATIANPGELAGGLLGRDVTVIEGSGAPEAARHFLFVNPKRLSTSTVTARLLRKAVKSDLATIVFAKSRKVTELVYTWATGNSPELRDSISAYRAGYLPEERRQIEKALFSGDLKGVVSTSALEVGIDIGILDVCILAGYPGTITTTWQRGGRVGRKDRDSLIVIVAGDDALDQYFMKHPEAFFESGYEPAVIDPSNLPILKSQLACAAAEIPLHRGDEWFSGETFARAVAELEREGALVRSVDDGSWHSARRYPQRDVNIRGIGEGYTIFEEEEPRGGSKGAGKKPRVIGSIDGNRVFSEGHPGAVYLHRATQYQVTRLDLERKNLWARARRVGYYTQARRDKETEILTKLRSSLVKNFVARLGGLKVTERVVGYEKKRIASQERLSTHDLDLPPSVFETVGFWIEIDNFIPRALEGTGLNFMGGIHALEHAAIALFPLFALCETDDIGGISIPYHPQLNKAAVFFYDGYPGGVGLSEKSFARVGELLERTHDLIAACECEKGCPSCIYSAKCGSGNVPLDKGAALAILAMLLDRPEAKALMPKRPDGEAAGEPFEPEAVEEGGEDDQGGEGPTVLVLDIETRRGADDVGGWGNIHLMGVAVAVTWNSRTEEFTSYFEDEVDDLLRAMAAADLVVGFNIVGFDYRVLGAYDNGTLEQVRTFDMLQDIHRRLGFRLSLAHLAGETIGAAKSADGLQSLAWVREGRLDLVEEYCRKDVEVTAGLFYHGLKEGWVRYRDREGRLLELVVDWNLDALAQGEGRAGRPGHV